MPLSALMVRVHVWERDVALKPTAVWLTISVALVSDMVESWDTVSVDCPQMSTCG